MKDATVHAWLRRVSDYHSGGVSAAERAAVEAHLAECVECRQALAAYRRFYALARSPLQLGDGGAGALTEYRLFTQEEFMPTVISPNHETGRTTTLPRRPRTTLTTLGAIAAVVVVAVLAGALFALHNAPSRPVSPHPTPTPALDAQTQAYVSVLRTYYPPFSQASADEDFQCHGQFNAAPAAQLPAIIQACRPLEVNALSAAQTLLARLQATPAPPRWRTADSQLKQAIQGHIAFHTERINAIDAHDVNRFRASWQQVALPADLLFCSSFGRFTTDLKNAGVPAASLQDLQPFDQTACPVTPAPEGAGG